MDRQTSDLLLSLMLPMAQKALRDPCATDEEKIAILFCAGAMETTHDPEHWPAWKLKPRNNATLYWRGDQWAVMTVTCAPDMKTTLSVGSTDDPVPGVAITDVSAAA